MSSRAIADTSLFIAREAGRPLGPHVEDREIAVSIVTIADDGSPGWLSTLAIEVRACFCMSRSSVV